MDKKCSQCNDGYNITTDDGFLDYIMGSKEMCNFCRTVHYEIEKVLSDKIYELNLYMEDHPPEKRKQIFHNLKIQTANLYPKLKK